MPALSLSPVMGARRHGQRVVAARRHTTTFQLEPDACLVPGDRPAPASMRVQQLGPPHNRTGLLSSFV
jgi:hypothetical protein